jgi:3-hydroxymyristoyl/3-hydroxydecanoyl-(acyl carrier protein) dehydratase
MTTTLDLSLPSTSAPWLPARGASPVPGVGRCRVIARHGAGFEVEIEQRYEAANPYQVAHFPGFRIYPGVFLLETIRQGLSAVLGGGGSVRVAAVRSMRFHAPVLEQAELSILARVEPWEQRGSGRWVVRARCRLADGTVAAETRLEVDGPSEPAGQREPSERDLPAIRRTLPHGHPMLLVDRVLELRPGDSIIAVKAITHAEPCYGALDAGAGPGDYAYPESLLLESFGQAAALMWMLGRDSGARGTGVLMLTVGRDCRIEGRALPGDVVRHEARLDAVVGDNVLVSGESFVGARRILTVGSMMAVIRPPAAITAHARGDEPERQTDRQERM